MRYLLYPQILQHTITGLGFKRLVLWYVGDQKVEHIARDQRKIEGIRCIGISGCKTLCMRSYVCKVGVGRGLTV